MSETFQYRSVPTVKIVFDFNVSEYESDANFKYSDAFMRNPVRYKVPEPYNTVGYTYGSMRRWLYDKAWEIGRAMGITPEVEDDITVIVRDIDRKTAVFFYRSLKKAFKPLKKYIRNWPMQPVIG